MKLVVILFICLFVVVVNQTSATEHTHTAKSEGVAGGKGEKGAKQSELKHAKKSTKSSKHDVEKARKGQTFKQIHKTGDEEGGGKKTIYYAEDGHKSSKQQNGGSGHGLKFQEGAKKKKLNYKRGYHGQYHKDLHKKSDRFFSNAHKAGEFEVYGAKNAKYSSNFSSKKQQENHKGSEGKNDFKKSSAKAGGHNDGDQKGYKDQKSTKSHHNREEKWAHKGAKKGGTQYKYKASPQR